MTRRQRPRGNGKSRPKEDGDDDDGKDHRREGRAITSAHGPRMGSLPPEDVHHLRPSSGLPLQGLPPRQCLRHPPRRLLPVDGGGDEADRAEHPRAPLEEYARVRGEMDVAPVYIDGWIRLLAQEAAEIPRIIAGEYGGNDALTPYQLWLKYWASRDEAAQRGRPRAIAGSEPYDPDARERAAPWIPPQIVKTRDASPPSAATDAPRRL